MARSIVLSILCVITTACAHSDGLRVEWNVPPSTSTSASITSAEAEEMTAEVDPAHDDLIADDDIYALVLDVRADRLLDVTFYDPTDGRFELSAIHCSRQGYRCMAQDLCPPQRLYRNRFEIDLERMRLRACVFAMEADPD